MDEVLKTAAVVLTVGSGLLAAMRYFIRNEFVTAIAALRGELSAATQKIEQLELKLKFNESQTIERLTGLERRILDSVKIELLERRSLPPQGSRNTEGEHA